MPLTSNDIEFLKTISELSEPEVFLKSELPEQSYGEEFRFSKLAKYELYRRSDAKRDAREETTLSIAKEANLIASNALEVANKQAVAAFEQARWAKWAAIIATIAAIIATAAAIR